ncbi:MAG: transcriptional regulator, MarR family [Promethearchaeota archaeon CR_4]|nr:MAG: transcriptional regulator, MarR family [Candidatus Lokiarchaeota archaeon CR_4]
MFVVIKIDSMRQQEVKMINTRINWVVHMVKTSTCEFNSDESSAIMDVLQLINKIGKKLDRLQNQLVQTVNITPPQYFILQILWKGDGIPFKDIASACCCTRSTITGIIDTLERKGLVYREPNPDDRRSQFIKLTPEGKALQNSVPPMETIFGTCCNGMGATELGQLRNLLFKFFNVIP